MVKWKILVSAPYLQLVLQQYRAQLESRGAELLVPTVNERLSEDELLRLVGDIDGVIAGDDHFTAKVLDKASPRLKVISKWGTGIDAFDLETCKKLGVAVRNTPGAFTDPVADSIMGYILNFARKLPLMDQQIKAGVWDKIPGKALHETTLGIIGFGNIGQAVAKRARGFGMRVIANDIKQMPLDVIEESGAEMMGLDKLLRNSDFVSVNCDLNPTSIRLMTARKFSMMKSDAVIINLARGPIVDEKALIDALQTGRIAGAALDVFEQEPLPGDNPLKSMSNVMLAPHNSNSSPEAWERVHQNTVQNLLRELEKELCHSEWT
jgi:D-3-phosphoglycerate dehydrogenase